jgi:hypothetical protein
VKTLMVLLSVSVAPAFACKQTPLLASSTYLSALITRISGDKGLESCSVEKIERSGRYYSVTFSPGECPSKRFEISNSPDCQVHIKEK